MKQLIIARKDLQMSPGKLAAQVSHASMAFLTSSIRASGTRAYDCEILRTWDFRPIFNDEELIKIREKIEENIVNIGELVQINDKWYLKRPQIYRREDLNKWATEARLRGEDRFYVRPIDPNKPYGQLELCEPTYTIQSTLYFDLDTWNDWINGSFTKIVCEAKNKQQLEMAVITAKELGLIENCDFFLIRDNCCTELTPEETDENGVGRTLTCIGFRPLPDEICMQLSKKYQLYR